MKIRDNRDKNWFWLDNEYLNGYAKHLGASCTVVYLSLCRFAHNEKQTCFPSMETIAEQNGIHRATVIRALKKLEDWNIVAVERAKKEDGTQANNVYTLLSKNEWKEKPSSNMQHSEAELQKVKEPSSNKLQSRVAQSNNNYTNINYTNINNTSKSEDLPFSFSEWIDELENSKRRDLQVIGFFLKEKNLRFATREQANSVLRRHLKSAKEVANFTDKQIVAVTDN